MAIVIGGYQFDHGEIGAKKALSDVAAGTGIAVLAAICGLGTAKVLADHRSHLMWVVTHSKADK